MQSAPWLYALARVFECAGAPLYLVGGAVRNPLMGLPLSDIDVCGPTLPEAVVRLCEGTEVRAHLRAAHFGTVELHVTDERGARHMAEYTTFREDSYRCGHRPDAVRFTTELSVDALRRDFSVNALYRRLSTSGEEAVIDPTGGLGHLESGVLHTVTDDPDQVLSDDGLRILRAARFQAELALCPTDALTASLARHAALLEDIAPERLRDELQKILLADLRYPSLRRAQSGAEQGLRTMFACGAWARVMRGIAWDERAVEGVGRLWSEGRAESAGDADALGDGGRVDPSSALCLRMALLGYRCGADAVRACMERMRFATRDARRAAAVADVISLFKMDELVLTNADGACPPSREALLSLAGAGREALLLARAALSDAAALARYDAAAAFLRDKPLNLAELRVNGDDLKPLLRARRLPNRALGALLGGLWQAALAGEVANEREALLALAETRV